MALRFKGTSAGFLVLAGMATCMVAVAQSPQGALEVKTAVQKVVESVDASGERKSELVAVDTAVPGDEVVYTVTFRNVGDRSADDVQITNPIPAELRYVDGTAFGPGTTIVYSVDGGSSYGAPDALQVTEADGAVRPAAPDDYTHIRFALDVPLPAGERSFARFHAIVR